MAANDTAIGARTEKLWDLESNVRVSVKFSFFPPLEAESFVFVGMKGTKGLGSLKRAGLVGLTARFGSGSTGSAAFLSALVGSEVAYSATQDTVATLSEAYETTKNHRSFPKNTSLQESEEFNLLTHFSQYNVGFVFDAKAGSGNSWLQHDFNSTNISGINEYRQGPLYSVFPMKLAQVSSVQNLFEFICSGPLLEKIGVTAEMVAEYIDKWLLYGRLLSQLFQLNELYLTVPQKARIYQYYIPVFLWCEDQIKQHWSTFKNEEDVPPLVIGFSAPQGCGKTTLVFALDYLFQKTGRKSATISIDDFYLTAEGQGKLRDANLGNSLLEFRGNAGSHDLPLSVETLTALSKFTREGMKIKPPRYDKSAFNGRGDRADPSTWPEVEGHLTVVLFEGWMLGFKPLPTEFVKAIDLQVR
ncbi:D-glycerate 3-kinase, chloroplastic-like, partial [Arachis duranensis]|uniref:D-glycerate 3-kinase, chloroplastic-like n=1 Tax=Arachis duranensis TaxID=130453 RepID=A0A9C6WF52_ARADU